MPNDPRSEPLSTRDLTLMRQIVIGIVPEAERLTHLSVGRPPGAESAALQFLEDIVSQSTPKDSSHKRHAHLAMGLYTFAALDHMRAFVPLLKTKRHIMPLATLTRGSVEALGKANYLLDANSASDLLRRHVSLATLELGNSVKHSEFAYHDGTKVDGKAYLEGVKDLVVQLGLSKPDQVNVTGLTSDLLNESSPGSPGRTFYSQLSGVAHGETAAVSMFIASDLNEGLRFVHKRDVLLPYAGMLFATCRLVLDKMIDHFGVEQEYCNGWRGVTERAEPWIKELRDSDPNL
ncbi:hypothetical protein [Arthrobacter cryoconiti]|uniref:Uncharacterized protein n=1 Tax=Arthrobacter cryoconiti TaxID=748907 RepID=A0ABV8R0B2_9MICC|nr:hypothetical protein [Arthrobacter cryoconiti]MCC9069864.1 hypothetical protein [Arthrobacter cryoconiti]